MKKWRVNPALTFRLGCVFIFVTLPTASSAQTLHLGSSGTANSRELLLASDGKALPIYVAPQESETLRLAAEAFAGDMERVTGVHPRIIASLTGESAAILLGTVDHSSVISALAANRSLDVSQIRGKWESSITATIDRPSPELRRALVIAGSDRRGAVYALFALSRQMGVSPWTWWADVPVRHDNAVCVDMGASLQGEPSVPYRGIFLNDEDWGLRPWAAAKMDPTLRNIGPNTYRRIFELLLRLRANTLWPAMHPGTLAFNNLPKNARLADRWGIVMGSSHSEAMLRNNVGEWNEQRDGPWNYQLNRAAIDKYWEQRVQENGKYENFYTVGMRGLHDSGLEATGTAEDKAHLVEDAMAAQRRMLTVHVNPHVDQVPQVLWLYKESLDLYRAGMKVPVDSVHRLRFAVTLDGQSAHVLDLSGAGEWKEYSAPIWETNVLRNDARMTLPLGTLPPEPHTLRLIYVDPGVAFEHFTIAFPNAPSAYPVSPETQCHEELR